MVDPAGYLPAVVVAVIGVLLLVVLVVAVRRHARRASRAAGRWQHDVGVATSTLRLGVDAVRDRRAGRG